MAALYMWYGLVLSVLTCLSICSTEAKCRGRTVLTDPQGSIKSGPDICEWLIKGEVKLANTVVKTLQSL